MGFKRFLTVWDIAWNQTVQAPTNGGKRTCRLGINEHDRQKRAEKKLDRWFILMPGQEIRLAECRRTIENATEKTPRKKRG